jgi:hypothetical protein
MPRVSCCRGLLLPTTRPLFILNTCTSPLLGEDVLVCLIEMLRELFASMMR